MPIENVQPSPDLPRLFEFLPQQRHPAMAVAALSFKLGSVLLVLPPQVSVPRLQQFCPGEQGREKFIAELFSPPWSRNLDPGHHGFRNCWAVKALLLLFWPAEK